MFRSLKKRVQSLGDSRHNSRGGGTHDDSSKQTNNDNGKLNTPRREAAPSSANINNNNNINGNGSTATTATASPSSFVSSSSGVATTNTSSASASSARKTVQKKLSRAVRQQQQEEEDLLHAATNNQGVPYLSAFDKCIETSDAMTASSSAGQNDSVLTTRQDATTGLPDCSLLVSPNGDLLLVPTLGQAGQQRPEDMFRNMRRRNNKNTAKEQGLPDSKGAAAAADEEDADAEKGDDVGLNELPITASTNSFSELMLHGKDDYESAVFCGNDLNVAGDKALNRFTSKGWSIPATSLALQQTGHSLTALAHFAEQLVLSRKESAARATIACDNLRSETEKRTFHLNMGGGLEQWEILDPRATDFEFVPGRVGPFQAQGTSTLRKAIAAMEQYYSHTAEKESRRWRVASLQHSNGNGNGVLPAMHEAVDHFHRRASNRERALQETSRRASLMEERLRRLKQESEKKWEAVYKAETRVTRRLEEFMTERSKERARVRLHRLRAEETQRRAAAADEMVEGAFGGGEGGGRVASLGGGSGTTINTSSSMSDEVWNLVSSVAESMDNGSFEPVSLEANDAVASVVSDDASAASSVAAEHNKDAAGSVDSIGTSSVHSSVTPIVSREEIEQEVGLPELRAAALKADDDIQDAADALLNILAALDTTRRSARIAAETCLVSAANAHAACLRSMLKLERESLQERLNDLDGLEEQLEQIDVRADLDAYICVDKKARGGRSHLGDDDDGGIASALATLSSHVDGSMGHDSSSTSSSDRKRMSESSKRGESASPLKLNEAVEKLFEANDSLCPDADLTAEDTRRARSEFEANTEFLCQSVAGNTPGSKSRRSTLCYALNSKRTHAKIATKMHFDALCKLFSEILNGCNGEGGVSNAKMCMMLSQTFYMENPGVGDDDAQQLDDSARSSPARQSRKLRIYVKNTLVGHPIWSRDEFWDVALSQQISESLTHSGVMSNFDRNSRSVRRTEWTQTRKPKWYDLNYTERSEAASQVHAVVFAQLGALAHSMIEFGCGLERSCAFVRRMSIRNQLPSSQRTMLLTHLMARDDVGRRESKVLVEPCKSTDSGRA